MSTNSPIQTNLFNRALLPKVEWLSAKRIPVIAAMVLGTMAVISGAILVRENMQSTDLSKLEQSVGALRDRKATEFPASVRKKKELLEKIAVVEKKIQDSRDMLAGMGQSLDGEKSTSGANVMKALSSTDNRAIWLDAIQYGVSEQSLSLSGHATDPKAIAPYIEALRAQPGMAGMTLGQLEVKADPSGRRIWNFSITGLNQGTMDGASSK